MTRKLRIFCILATILAVVAVVVWFRARSTVEYRAVFGDVATRQELCRTLPKVSPQRHGWILRRFLLDKSDVVQAAAVHAYTRGARCEEASELIAAIIQDPQHPDHLRESAGLALLQSTDLPTDFTDFLDKRASNPAFQESCPKTAARWLLRHSAEAGSDQLADLLRHASTQTAVAEELRRLILDQPEPFTAVNDMIRQQHAQASDVRLRNFYESMAAALALDLSPEEPEVVVIEPEPAKEPEVVEIDPVPEPESVTVTYETAKAAPPEPRALVPGHVIEAEWALQVTPNYHIGHHKRERCLMLGEGAGGYMGWLKGHDATVDIGTAVLPFYVPSDGAYLAYARVYLDDKCGNSFGFSIDKSSQIRGRFKDKKTQHDKWHWLPLCDETNSFQLKKGYHRIHLEAWEDAVFIDKFAIVRPDLPVDELDESVTPCWDPGSRPGISFGYDYQAQPRSTTQTITVYVSRTSKQMKDGHLTLKLPKPFVLKSPETVPLAFAEDAPLAAAEFQVELPKNAVGGEVLATATYFQEEPVDAVVTGTFIFAAQLDWLTTGPLSPDSKRHQQLQHMRNIDDEALKTWSRLPDKGFDTYRRIVPEEAWGPLENKYIYFCTDIEVTEGGKYKAFLTADDHAFVHIDGELVINQNQRGPAEGRMMIRRIQLSKGRHRIFIRLRQLPGADPTGEDADRHALNNCALKLILRKQRHTCTPEIAGLPMSQYQD